MSLLETGSEEDLRERRTIQGSQKVPTKQYLEPHPKPVLLRQYNSIKWMSHNDKDGNGIGTKVSSLGSVQISTCEGLTELI